MRLIPIRNVLIILNLFPQVRTLHVDLLFSCGTEIPRFIIYLEQQSMAPSGPTESMGLIMWSTETEEASITDLQKELRKQPRAAMAAFRCIQEKSIIWMLGGCCWRLVKTNQSQINIVAGSVRVGGSAETCVLCIQWQQQRQLGIRPSELVIMQPFRA